MSVSERVELKNGGTKVVFADNKEELAEAVKVAKNEEGPVYPNINHPVQKGHDLAAAGPDASTVLLDGEGAHNSPYDAIDENGKERGDKNVTAAGLEEPAYKQVPEGHNDSVAPFVASEKEVAAAKKDSAPLSEVQPEPAKDKNSR